MQIGTQTKMQTQENQEHQQEQIDINENITNDNNDNENIANDNNDNDNNDNENIANESKSHQIGEHIISSLFLQDYGEDILLSTRTSTQTIIYRIIGIERYVLLAKLPKYSNSDFVELVKTWFDDFNVKCQIMKEPIEMFDANVSLLGQKWQYFKIIGNLKDLQLLTQTRETEVKNTGDRPCLTFEYDNYLVPDFSPRSSAKMFVSRFYERYYETLMSLTNLSGVDKLIHPYLRYPFRQVGQNYISIQYKYDINFFNPMIVKKVQHTVQNPLKYRADVVHYVDIDDLENIQPDDPKYDPKGNKKYDIEEIVQTQMQNYCSIMFDIENFVFIPSKTKHETYNLLRENQSKFSELSNIYFQTYNKVPENKLKFCDQEQITMISFVEQNFKSQILKKYCLINLGDTPNKYTAEQIKDKINNEYSDDQAANGNTNNQTQQKMTYADEVFIYNNERDLLIKTIEILGNPKYHIVQHFNGWKFDEPMICIRFLLYNLFDEYVRRICPVYQPLQQLRFTLPCNAIYKQSAQTIETNLTQIKSPLKFSLDVYQLNLHDDVGAQKHDGGNSLNSLLKYHNLGLKGDISYQQICDAFENRDLETLIKAAWYCQRDSIQQARLQQKLRIILNHIQFARLCQISLKDSVQQAVGMKVISTAYRYYANNNVAFQDVLMPYQRPQTITKIVSGETREHKVTNIGGEVECFLPGFSKCVSAVDAASMYPAQIEANNVSNNCMLYPYQMDDILQNRQAYNIQSIKPTYIIDLYSPYVSEKFVRWTKVTQEFIDQYQEQNGKIDLINMLNYIYVKRQHLKQPRLRIDLVFNSGQIATYEQFYFDKKDITNEIKYVWYLQGKNPENQNPWSPRSTLLTSFRFLRKSVKKQIKQATDPDLKAFYDGKQGAIKVCMNSLYGTTDTTSYALFENIGAAIITRCSKCEIRNCRDNIQATGLEKENTFYIQPRHKIDELVPLIKQYNSFCRTFFQQANQLKIQVDYVKNNSNNQNTQNGQIPQSDNQNEPIIKYIRFPKLSMKYQDTDSNYFVMDVLDNIPMKDISDLQQQWRQQNSSVQQSLDENIYGEHYFKPHLFGMFNLIFSTYINNSMDKFPLEFGFEGAFYRAWHIGKKQYLGQKVPQFTLDVTYNAQNEITQVKALSDVHISKHVQLSDYNPDVDDIYVFISNRHLKVTGIKIVKRDATLLTKKYYMKFIEQILNNEEIHDHVFMQNIITELIKEIKNDFINGKINLKQISIAKKITVNDLKQNALQYYNQTHPGKELGLGQMLYQYVQQIESLDPFILQLSGLKIADYQICISEEQLNDICSNAYFAYYLLQVTKSLVSFEMLYENMDDLLASEKSTIGMAIQKVAYELLLNRNILQKQIQIYRFDNIQNGLSILQKIVLSKLSSGKQQYDKQYFHKFVNEQQQEVVVKVITDTLINRLQKEFPKMTSIEQNNFKAYAQQLGLKLDLKKNLKQNSPTSTLPTSIQNSSTLPTSIQNSPTTQISPTTSAQASSQASTQLIQEQRNQKE